MAINSLSYKWDLPVRPSDAGDLISSVHSSTFIGGLPQLQQLDRLLDSNFFAHCAWRHFHQDCGQSHLELVVALLNRDFERSHLLQLAHNLWDVVFDDLQRWCALRDRILHLISSIKAGSLRLASGVFCLLSNVVRRAGDHVFEMLPLWENNDEILSILTRYMASCVLLSKCDDLALFHSSLSSFLVSCLANTFFAPVITSVVLRTNFVAFTRCHISVFGDALQAIKFGNETLDKAVIKSEPLLHFSKVQEYLCSLPPSKSNSRFVSIPSVYDCSDKDVLELVPSLSLSSVKRIFTVATGVPDPIDFANDDDTRKVLTQAIIDAVTIKPDMSRTRALFNFDETIVDAHAHLLAAKFENINATLLPVSPPFSSSRTFEWAWHNLLAQARTEISDHVILVLVRVRSHDFPQVKGLSKYWYPITSIEKKAYSQYAVTCGRSSIQECQFVALIELVKPTDFSPHKRVRSYGLASMRVGQVMAQDKMQMRISCMPSMEMLENRMKFLVVLPNTESLASLSAYMRLNRDPCLPRSSHSAKRKLDEVEDYENKRGKSSIATPCEGLSKPQAVEDAQNPTLPPQNEHKDGNDIAAAIPSNEPVTTDGIKPLPPSQIAELGKPLESIFDLSLSAIPCTRAHNITGIVEALVNNTNKRWLVIVPSLMFLDSVPDTRTIKNFEYLKFGEVSDLEHILALINNCRLTIANLFEKDDSYDERMLNQYMQMITSKWHQHTRQYTNDDPEYVSQYPFSKSLKSATDVQNDYDKIQASLKFLKEFGMVSRFGARSWDALCRGRTVITTFRQYLNMGQALCDSFDRVCVVGLMPEALSLIASRHKLSQLALLGGNTASLFTETCSLPYLPVRPDFCLHASVSPPRSFNPGFKFTSQRIYASDQVEEAEYCVTLYQYMRLLGYPQATISLWASTAQQGALMAEIVKKRCGGARYLYGEPQIHVDGVEHVLDSREYSIVSTFGSIGTSLYGRLGNYWVGAGTKKRLLLLAGENYYTSTRSDLEIYEMDGKDHLEKYVESMEKMRPTKHSS